ncbi:MAG: hypothetical protein ABJC26_09500 [Gemmatimonadaceae bacterium]
MSRFANGTIGILALMAMVACNDATRPELSAGPTTARASGGGGGGSGGGGGGVVAVVPPACSQISLTPKSGYTPRGFGYAAIWVNIKLKNCGTTPITLQAELMQERTGVPAGSSGGIYLIPPAVPYVDITPQPWVAQPGDSLMVTADYEFDLYATS